MDGWGSNGRARGPERAGLVAMGDMRQHAPWMVAKGLLLMRAGLSPELNPTIVLLQEQSRGISEDRNPWKNWGASPHPESNCDLPLVAVHLPRAGVQARQADSRVAALRARVCAVGGDWGWGSDRGDGIEGGRGSAPTPTPSCCPAGVERPHS